jgi:DNA repair protein RecO (recombination protein O)
LSVRVELQPAYVLHTRSYRDSSLLVELLSRDYGRIAAVAKGAKTGARKRAGKPLQPFTPILASWLGKTSLKTLTQREMTKAIPALLGDSLYSGLYINELLVRVLQHEDPHPGIFDLYHQTLLSLGGDLPVDVSLRYFELGLLEALGYGIDLNLDSEHGEPIFENRDYHYINEVGLVPVQSSSEKRPGVFRGKDLCQMAAGQYSEEARLCAKRLLRQALAPLIGDKPLNSRSLFEQYRKVSK